VIPQVTDHILSPDTQTVLLLCGRFGKERNDANPLTDSEYNRLALWLKKQGMRPADLLGDAGQHLLEKNGPPIPESRLRSLLGRGTAMALAVESWASKGLWVSSRSDKGYPQRLRSRKKPAPPILYGVGDIGLLSDGGLAIVGSRDADEEALDFCRKVARSCAKQEMQVVSGGARGIDTEAMVAALEAGGSAVGVLPGDLAKAALRGKYRNAIQESRLVLVSPYDPGSGFNVGHAMQRNRHIYALADYGLVVSSSPRRGGTWSGAVEALKHGEPVFVRSQGQKIPDGNHNLGKIGALPFPEEPWTNLAEKLRQSAENSVLQEQLLQDHPVDEQVVDDGRNDASHCKTAYDAVLPTLLAHLERPLESKALAELLDTNTRQTQAWLAKAVKEEKVKKLSNPVRYVADGRGS
jgi:predicted Rossmann fold nucleotide-binding protein DprA/Smf involved in DNA uptake